MPVPPPHQPQSEQPDPEFGEQVPAVPYVVPDDAAHGASAQYATQYAQQHSNMLDPAAPESSYANAGTPTGVVAATVPPHKPHKNKPHKNKWPLPWILTGTGVVVGAAIVSIVSVTMVSGLPFGGNKTKMVDAPTVSASFQYPEGWIRISESYTINNKDDDLPSAELFAAVNNSGSATSMLFYEATKRPPRELTKEEIHTRVNQGLARQLAATQEDLASDHSVIAFGCVDDFSYTNKPVIVERNGLYGLRYGYTCFSSQGDITGEYLVGFDTVGRSYRMAVEALDSEWDNSKSALKAVVDSVQPNPLP
ncbi:hypothetical protein [Specibacter sp. NPDC078692]|uniref:hypothetical protein n=1 Tax=Specibacter sp. NPDC078692 TaxID=3155818 RepID=UPI003412EF01